MTRLLALLFLALLLGSRPAPEPALSTMGVDRIEQGDAESSVAQERTAVEAAPQPAADVPPSSAATLTGTASWYPAKGLVAAAGPALRRFFGGEWDQAQVTVCAAPDGGCVTVRLAGWCECYRGTPDERLIDLSDDAFAQLAPLSAGLIRVRVMGAIVPPATDALP